MRQLKITKQVTNREDLSLEKYLQEVGRQEMITPEEEIELGKRIKQWDQKALERLVKANLRFVVSVAKQYQNQWLRLPDLINEGNLGLIKAAWRFDETRGFKFISYAVRWIRQSILHALATKGRLVRIPLNQIWDINKINRSSNKLEQILEREPTKEEIAEAAELSIDEVINTSWISQKHISYDAPMDTSDPDNDFLSIISSSFSQPNDQQLIKEWLSKELCKLLSILDDRSANIIKMYYGVDGQRPHTLEEIWENFDLTRERARQIKEAAIRRLKTTLTRNPNNHMRGYLQDL